MKADTTFEPTEPRVSEASSLAAGSCNVYGCGTTTPSAKVWCINLGSIEVRVCRRHARAVRTQLPSR